MADTNKETLVQKITNIADGFRTSRSLTETLSLDEMAELAAVPIGSADNKLPQLVDGTITEITAEDLQGATAIRSYMFYNSTRLEAITLPNTIRRIEKYAFSSEGFNTANKITNFVCPNSITLIEDEAFSQNQYLERITLPQNSNFKTIPRNMFEECIRLNNVVLPNSITRISANAFYSCSALTNITLSNSLTYIASGAFNRCSALTNLTIPASVTEIAASSTLNIGTSTNKATITFLGTTPPYVSTTSFSVISLNKIIVPAGCGEVYKSATNWANLADYIEEAAV